MSCSPQQSRLCFSKQLIFSELDFIRNISMMCFVESMYHLSFSLNSELVYDSDRTEMEFVVSERRSSSYHQIPNPLVSLPKLQLPKIWRQ